MRYSIEEIKNIIGGVFLNAEPVQVTLKYPVFDSRMSSFENESIFFALPGENNDGHKFIIDAYGKGIRSFVVSEHLDIALYPAANFILVDNTLVAFQILAQDHRAQLEYPILAITGSNGKTIIKEWLFQVLSSKYKVGKTPLSYNSQIGVPYSILSLATDNDIGIIEAGISEVGEMQLLENIIRPDLGLFTNLGDAHAAGFENEDQKLEEKAKLFQNCKTVIHCNKDQRCAEIFSEKKGYSWGNNQSCDIKVEHDTDYFNYTFNEHSYKIKTSFQSREMLENFHHVVSYLIIDGWSQEDIQQQTDLLVSVSNRLEVRKGLDRSILINDSYSSDLASAKLALEFLEEKAQGKRRVVVISEFDDRHEGENSEELLMNLLYSKEIDELHMVGMKPSALLDSSKTKYYKDTAAFLDSLEGINIKDAFVLIKGAQKYKLEKVVSRLSLQVHQTRMEINLNAIGHNINVFRRLLKPETKVMAVVKASAYGSGSEEMVRYLESRQIDQLAVALIDEAVELRKNGCHIPIMIFNVQEDQLDLLWQYDLEPEVYSFSLLHKLIIKAREKKRPINVHLKIDSGMHRLGFMSYEIDELIGILSDEKWIQVSSVFSHLASSGNLDNDAYTHKQVKTFQLLAERVASGLDISPDRHILNSSGIIRFPQYQFDMVRLGLGMYGIDETGILEQELQKAHELKAQVLQLKKVHKDDAIGYELMGRTKEEAIIAVVSLGYADGLIRQCGNGRYALMIDGRPCPTIGNVCMDVTMVLLPSDMSVREGAEVTIFGPHHPIEDLAKACNTITYEVLSRISPRVKRTYVYH